MSPVGSRTATESIATIVQAFLVQRTWKQADLARKLEIAVPAVKRRLEELRTAGMPLEREEDHPHVYWSVPKGWFPGGVLYGAEDVGVLLRQLQRMPRSKDRDRLLSVALKCVPGGAAPAAVVVPPAVSGAEEKHLAVIEDAAARRASLRFRYYSASRGSEALRWASVHRVIVGPPARFLATCHRTDGLKWFRVDNVFDAAVDASQPFRDAAPAEIEALLRGTLDGFYDAGARAERHSFFVRDPDARWVSKNLLEGMHATDAPGGVRVTIETTAIERLARFVVGLGGAAVAETDTLRDAVVAKARGALEANDPSSSAAPVRSTRTRKAG
jgi:predicted DNA-binding transcriptional regulator YafY